MGGVSDLSCGLGRLLLLSNAKTRSISAENPAGEKGRGTRAEAEAQGPASDLGKGWKCRPYITLPPNSTTTPAEVQDPAVIQHVWTTVRETACRDCVLRVTIQALGWWPNGKFQPLADDIASVAYWYQTEPHVPFPAMPPSHERWPR